MAKNMHTGNFDIENLKLIKDAVLDVMTDYDTGSKSLRSILREYRAKSSLDNEILATVHFLAIGAVRFQNTLNFILTRSAKNLKFKSMPLRDRILLRVFLYWLRWHPVIVSEISGIFLDEDKRLLSILKQGKNLDLFKAIMKLPKKEKLSIDLSHPTFIVETLLTNLNETEAISLMNANNYGDFSYLRLNRLLTRDNTLISALKEKGADLEQDKEIPEVYRIHSGVNEIIKSESFIDRRVLIHDKASVVTAKTLAPRPGDTIWDACAAPGMKTQFLWEMMNSRGTIIATEINEKRLEGAIKQSLNLGTSDIDWQQADASRCPVSGANKILIDAPCTSTGMIHSHPSFKWRLNKKTLFSIMTIQNKILEGILSGYSDCPGTEVVYATCSILPHEGESQIDSILDKYPVELVDNPLLESTGYTNFNCSKQVRRMFPHTHETDGFFIAKLRITH